MSRHTNLRPPVARQSRPGSLQLVKATSALLATHPPVSAMTADEARTCLTSLRERLQQKMTRERAYMDRRARRGTHTPTDEAYEDDQQLEAELLNVLDQCMQELEAGPHEE